MSEFFRRHSLSLSSAFLLVISCILMGASVHNRSLAASGPTVIAEVLSPFDRVYQGGLQSVRSVWNHYVYLIGVEEERNQMAARLKALESQNSQFNELESENARLKALLNYAEQNKVTGVAATVISRDPSNWAQSITIDRGDGDGVRPGQPVVDGNGIVGQVVGTSRRSAKVQLLTDNVSAIDALVQSSRAEGSAEGTLSKVLKLRYVQRESVVNVGDRVIASGLDGVFPKGALVGVVTRVERDTGGMFQLVDVEPSVDVSRLENVLVLPTARPAAETGS